MNSSTVSLGYAFRRWGKLLLPFLGIGLIALGTASCSGGGPDTGKTPTNALLGAGIRAEQQGQTSAAQQLFLQVLARDPHNYYAHYNLGVIFQSARDNTDALQQYAQALASNPSYVPALFNEATIYGGTDPQLAMTTYRHVIQLQAHAPTAYLNLGLLEIAHGLRQQGLRDLVVGLRQDPSLAKGLPPNIIAQVGNYLGHIRPSSSPSTTPSH